MLKRCLKTEFPDNPALAHVAMTSPGVPPGLAAGTGSPRTAPGASQRFGNMPAPAQRQDFIGLQSDLRASAACSIAFLVLLPSPGLGVASPPESRGCAGTPVHVSPEKSLKAPEGTEVVPETGMELGSG